MGIQEILLMLIFGAAVVYVGRSVYKNFQTDKGCGSGCGKCGVDFSEVRVEKSLKE